METRLAMPELSEQDFIQGGMILTLIETWSDWVHRRVEYVTLSEPQASERRVSVDFTLAPTVGTTPVRYARHTSSAYLVPVAWIEKHRITRFSLRDEGQNALPVWTQLQTAVIATAVLAEAATDVAQPPAALLQSIAAKLPLPDPPSIPMDVLHDLWFIASAHPEDAIKRWESFSKPPRDLDDPDSRTKSEDWRGKLVESTDFVDLANDFARNFLIVTPLNGEPGSRRIVKMSFEERRKDTPITGDPNDGVSLPGHNAIGKLRTALWQVQRFLGLRAKRIVLPASSVGRAECFHLEIDVPEGIRLTRGRLRAYLPTKVVGDAAGRQHNNDHLVDVVTRSTQCVHLHLANVPRRFTGASILALRIGDGLVLRGAWINAVFTTAVLTLAAADPGGVIRDPASAIAVLVGIPGGISLYIARSREPGMSTSMHAGVRLLALGNALAAFSAAVIILTAGECKDIAKPAKQVCTRWGGTNTSLIVLAALAGLMLMSLSIAYYFSRRPPELRATKAAENATPRNEKG
jgi:hypothetical protein